MFYGTSGTGKTTLIYFLALWMYETFGLTTRVISNDLGGWGPIEREGLIDLGIVDAFNCSARKNLLADMRKLSRGWWPKVVKEEREVDGETRLVGVRRIVEDKEALAKVGLYFIEGATSTSTAFMRHISGQAETVGPQDVSGRYEEDGEHFGGNSKGHFNIVQTEMHGLFAGFSALPGNVRLVAWTAHEGSGKIRRTGESCYAPQLAGEAKNDQVPSWVGDCFHLQQVPIDEQGTMEIRAYYSNHPERTSEELGNPVYYLAKTRVGPSKVEALQKEFPGGYIRLGLERGDNIDKYFQWLEDTQGKSVGDLRKWKEGIDGK